MNNPDYKLGRFYICKVETRFDLFFITDYKEQDFNITFEGLSLATNKKYKLSGRAFSREVSKDDAIKFAPIYDVPIKRIKSYLIFHKDYKKEKVCKKLDA